MVPAVTRFARTKTALVIAAAGGVVAAALLLSARVHPPDEIVDAGGLALGARATSTAVMRGTSETHLAITIRAPEADHRTRPPISLAVVLDVSGSMEGEKLAHAKAAARHVIDELGDGDRFALISFSTSAQLLVPETAATADAKQRATAAIGGLYADGGTNISDGLQVGAGAISAGAAGDDGVRRIVLISDGEPQQDGITDPDQLIAFAGGIAAHGVSISTVGVGLGFNESIMTGIAVGGRGNYYFVEDTAQLAAMFDHELDSLGQTIASDASIAITPGDGVEVLETYGYRAIADGDTMIVPIADLRAGETRKVVVRVRVTARPGQSSMDLASVKLTFRPRGEHQVRIATTVARAEITDDVDVVTARLDREAVRQAEQAQTARALEEATQAYQQGDEHKAREILTQRQQAAQAAAAAVAAPDIADDLQTITDRTEQGFAAPPAGDGGSRAAKTTRKDAYDLAR